jgi:hypothetical protein
MIAKATIKIRNFTLQGLFGEDATMGSLMQREIPYMILRKRSKHDEGICLTRWAKKERGRAF